MPLLEAEVYELENQKEKALEKYQAALERGEMRLPVFQRVLQLLYELGRYAEASALLGRLPEQAAATGGLGRLAAELSLRGALNGEGQDSDQARREALERARKAVASNSADHRDYLWLAEMARLAGHRAESEKALRKAKELNASAPDTWVALLVFLAGHDRPAALAELAEAKRRLAPEQLPLVLALGRS